jgi:hypothetical protein
MDFVMPLLALVAPHLPALLNKAAETVVGEGAKKAVFEAVPAGVKAIWAKLSPKVEASAIASESAKAIALDPTDEDAATMLKLALKKVLLEIEKSEPELLAELKTLMDGDQSSPEPGKNAGTVTGTIYSSVMGDRANVTQTIGVPPGK